MATRQRRIPTGRSRGKGFVVAVLADGVQTTGKGQRKALDAELRLGKRKPPLRVASSALHRRLKGQTDGR